VGRETSEYFSGDMSFMPAEEAEWTMNVERGKLFAENMTRPL
jgi:hypothetical protein